jgi:WD40 repeat protein
VGSGKITSIAMARDGNRVACGSAVGRVSVWDLGTSQELSHLDTAAPIGCVRWSQTSDELAISVGNFATAEQAALLIWNPLATQPRHELVLNSPAGAIAWLSGDASLLVADWGGQSGVWTFDAETLTTGGLLPKDTVSAAAWSPDCPLVSPGFVAEFLLGAAE